MQQRRKEVGVGQQHVADKLGVVKTSISMIERGTNGLIPEHVEPLSMVLDVPPDYIYFLMGVLPPDFDRFDVPPKKVQQMFALLRSVWEKYE